MAVLTDHQLDNPCSSLPTWRTSKVTARKALASRFQILRCAAGGGNLEPSPFAPLYTQNSVGFFSACDVDALDVDAERAPLFLSALLESRFCFVRGVFVNESGFFVEGVFET